MCGPRIIPARRGGCPVRRAATAIAELAPIGTNSRTRRFDMARSILKVLLIAMTIAAPATAQPVSEQAAPTQVVPETGWWFSPAEGGRGYAIEQRNGNVFMAALMYNPAGVPTWYLGNGPLVNGGVFTDLQFYGFGANLFFPYAPALRLGSTAATVSFTSARTGTVQFPDAINNNSSAIQRFQFAPTGAGDVSAVGLPENGCWWAPSEPGVG